MGDGELYETIDVTAVLAEAVHRFVAEIQFSGPGRIEVEVNADQEVRAVWKHELTRIPPNR